MYPIFERIILLKDTTFFVVSNHVGHCESMLIFFPSLSLLKNIKNLKSGYNKSEDRFQDQ